MTAKDILVGKMAQMNCAILERHEVERCFAGCCSPSNITKIALRMIDSGKITMDDIRAIK